MHANSVSIFTGTTNLEFSRICSSMMPDPNGTTFTVKVSSTEGRPHSNLNFEKDSSAIPEIQAIKQFLRFFFLWPSLIYCLFPVPYFSTNWCKRRWLLIIIIIYAVDLLTALLEYLDLEGARLCCLLSKNQLLMVYAQLMTEWYCASNHTSSAPT